MNFINTPVIKDFFRFLLNKNLERKNRWLHLKLGNSANISDCNFGKYNNVGEGTVLTSVNINDFTYISDNCVICRTEIGKFCSVAPGVLCGLGMHPTKNFVSTHPAFFSDKKQSGISFTSKNYFQEYKPIKIGNDVWIGARAIIIDGVTVGDGAIIGAGAVVTKDVKPYAIVGGVPAKTIRYRFNKKQIEYLQKFKWWDKNYNWLKKNYLMFHNIEEFVKGKFI
jgi:acetyltransferase-like isoleucine patch superfamily enzyme